MVFNIIHYYQDGIIKVLRRQEVNEKRKPLQNEHSVALMHKALIVF